jgi:hypothetical protein
VGDRCLGGAVIEKTATHTEALQAAI